MFNSYLTFLTFTNQSVFHFVTRLFFCHFLSSPNQIIINILFIFAYIYIMNMLLVQFYPTKFRTFLTLFTNQSVQSFEIWYPPRDLNRTLKLVFKVPLGENFTTKGGGLRIELLYSRGNLNFNQFAYRSTCINAKTFILPFPA